MQEDREENRKRTDEENEAVEAHALAKRKKEETEAKGKWDISLSQPYNPLATLFF